jgi:hypothetical protein
MYSPADFPSSAAYRPAKKRMYPGDRSSFAARQLAHVLRLELGQLVAVFSECPQA